MKHEMRNFKIFKNKLDESKIFEILEFSHFEILELNPISILLGQFLRKVKKFLKNDQKFKNLTFKNR